MGGPAQSDERPVGGRLDGPAPRERGAGGRQQFSCCAVVVHWTDAKATSAAVASIRSSDPSATVVLVDNGSEDGSGEVLSKHLGASGNGSCVFVRAPRNEGFGAGANLGIAAALARNPDLGWLVLVNPDLRLAADALPRLLATAVRVHRAGVVGGRLLKGEPPSEALPVWYEAGRLRPFTLSGSHVDGPPGAYANGWSYPTGFVTGALMLCSGDMLRQGIRFREDLFLYGEDLDLCLQARAAGWRCYVNPMALGWHGEAGSQRPGCEVLPGMSAQRLYWITRNKVALARRWLPWWQRWVFYGVTSFAKPLAGVVRFGRLGFLRPYFRALWHGFTRGASGRDAQGRSGGVAR